MNLTRTIVVFLVVVLVTPTSLFIVPQRVHAFGPTSIVADWSPSHLLDLAKNTITSIESATSAVAETALVVDKYVLEPLAFITSGNLVKSITAGVLDFVGGTTNGTGRPQFIQNLQGHLQGVGDAQALSFLTEFSRNSNSPFASSIVSSLRTNYLQDTSLNGFFVANRSTLSRYSPNPNAFLAGDWSQGGTAAWFALTTQDHNNPYMLHARAQAELRQEVANATSARLTELGWGQGFLSWCGADSSSSKNSGVATTPNKSSKNTSSTSKSSGGSKNTSSTSKSSGGSKNTSSTSKNSSGLLGNYNYDSKNVPGDACTNADGSPGTIKTPGSTIKASLGKALGLNADKVTSFGNQVGPEINAILGSIATVMQTANFATNVLGGSNGGISSTGMIGSPSRAALQNFQNRSGYLGSTQRSVNKNAASQSFSGRTLLSNLSLYEASWNTIRSAANAASSALIKTTNICNAAGDTAQATAANHTRLSSVVPVLSKVARIKKQIASTRAFVAKVQTEANATGTDASGAYQADLQTLQTMPPTATDVANAQEQAMALGATNTTTTIVDQMNRISKNAVATRTSCSFSSSFRGYSI